MKAITEFQGSYRWLSNFWNAPVVLDGVIYPSVENAYQAAKTTNSESRIYFVDCSAGQAKRRSRALDLRPDWDEIRVSIMRKLLQQKFKQNTVLARQLIATNPLLIIEGNNWNDTFWGVCRGVGENNLGKLLMEQRKFLIEGKINE